MMHPDCGHTIIDTYPGFLETLSSLQGHTIEEQIDIWARLYLGKWPELLAKQQNDYAEQGVDWRSIAGERAFPFLDSRLPDMQLAHDNLVELVPLIWERTVRSVSPGCSVVFVIYVGIGCGAGWATRYADSPAVLLGLENIAECGWADSTALAGLLAHELGHIVHSEWRRQASLADGTGALWQLYEEGFAQFCEHRILGNDSWHMQHGVRTETWLAWCDANQGWLARELLRSADQCVSVRPFFGSWYDVRGCRQTGYYLGHEVIRRLVEATSLREVALLDDYGRPTRSELEQLADTAASNSQIVAAGL